MVPTKGPDASQKLYFGALYAKRKAAKNRSSKSWMDGIVVNQDPTTTLMDMTGKIVAKGKAGTCVEGTTMEIGNWEVEVQDAVSEESFLSGAALAGGSTGPAPALPNVAAAAPAPFRPAVGSIRGGVSSQKLIKPPLFDPTREGAVVLSTPGTSFPEGESNTTVVIDPFVGVHLRPHQRAGVKFMYECVTGLRRGGISDSTHRGCLLAHEMGMGKTLQVIALLWTLLKQGPIAGKPAVRKAVIACPASLVGNWGGEIKKWLGDVRCEPLLVEGGEGADGKQKFEDWALPGQRKHSVLVTSYETLRAHAKTVAKATGGIDLLVCDEAHRLKNAKGDTQTVAAIRGLKCDRRVLLTGTPIQNDLLEFYAVMDFACPGLLGDAACFKKIYGAPVQKVAGQKRHSGGEEDRRREERGARADDPRVRAPRVGAGRQLEAPAPEDGVRRVRAPEPGAGGALPGRAQAKRSRRLATAPGAAAAAEAVQQRGAGDAPARRREATARRTRPWRSS